MTNIDRAYVAIGLAWLVLGMILGLHMGATANNTYLDVHVAMVLVGFVVLTFYGVVYRLWPTLKAGSPAKAQFWIANSGTLGITVGTFLLVNQMGVAVVAAGSVLAILGAALMLWHFWAGTRDLS